MIRVLILLVVSILLASLYSKGNKRVCKYDNGMQTSSSSSTNYAFILLLIILVLFAGLRTQMNDTITYVNTFLNDAKTPAGLASLFSVDWSWGSHTFFLVFQRLVKTIFGNNSQWFLLCHALVVVSSYLFFLRKYSSNFFWSMFSLLAFTVYAFSMAAMKQTMAIAIGIWAVPAFVNKKYVKSSLIFLSAMLFHQYVFILLSCMLLSDGVWTRKSWIVVVISLAFFLAFSRFVDAASDVAEYLGKEYEYEKLTSSGVGISRVIAYGIIPLFSFFCRKKINEKRNPLLNISVNASMVSFCFMLVASNGGAVLLGRISSYFNVLTCLAVPDILNEQSVKYKKLIQILFVVFMLLFYFTYYQTYLYGYCSGNWFAAIYNHASIFSLL